MSIFLPRLSKPVPPPDGVEARVMELKAEFDSLHGYVLELRHDVDNVFAAVRALQKEVIRDTV